MNHSTLSEPQAPARGSPTEPQARARGLLKIASPVLIIAAVGVTLWVNAGDLNPPPGPVASTMKTMTEVEPRTPIFAADLPLTINQSGSYYFAENITAADNGILIQADNVTVDLMGFTLAGGSGRGIRSKGGHINIAIKNGTISGWPEGGVDLSGGRNCHISNIVAVDNEDVGIFVGPGSVVTGCTVSSNVSTCIETTGGNCIVIGCTVRGSPNSFGISAGASAVINCTAKGAGIGIFGPFSTIIGCTAVSNQIGIGGSGGTLIANCAANSNSSIGILVEEKCRVVGNTCIFNADAGIRASQTSNHIEGNTVTQNGRGISVEDTGNIILKNTASGNTTNYDIVAGNSFGPIVNVVGVGDISGTAGADHPWANFEY